MQQPEAQRWTLWLNQLPFTATREDIARHFACSSPGNIRLIIKSETFAGTAFVEVPGPAELDRGLALHQSTITCRDGSERRINVREAVDKETLGKIAANSAAKRNLVLAKAYGSQPKKAAKPADKKAAKTAKKPKKKGGCCH